MSKKFVVMVKDGERLEVHPTTVKAHEAVGWVVLGQINPIGATVPQTNVPVAKPEPKAKGAAAKKDQAAKKDEEAVEGDE